MRQLSMLGIKVTDATIAMLHDEMDRIIGGGRQGVVLSANAHAVNLARSRPWLADFFKEAELVHVDGGGIIIAARMRGIRIRERSTWADWWPRMASHFAAQKYSLFLLGGPAGLAQAAAAGVSAHAPEIRIVGTHHGYFQADGPENAGVIKTINAVKPDVLWVGMGMPLQEKWIRDNRAALDVKLIMVCGSAFKYMAGLRSRCPRWMQMNHLEWLWMLAEEPRRGLVRYLWGNPRFLLAALLEAMRSTDRRT